MGTLNRHAPPSGRGSAVRQATARGRRAPRRGLAGAAATLLLLLVPGMRVAAGPPEAFDAVPAGAPVAVRLRTGAVVEGRYGGRTEEALHLETDSGRVTIPAAALWDGSAPGGERPSDTSEAAGSGQGPARAPVATGRWMPQIEIGINGSEGNSPTRNLRLGALAERTTRATSTRTSAVWTRAEQDGDLTESRVLADASRDWLLPGSPWLVFALGGLEYDQFKDFDVRLNAAGGPGYAFVRTDRAALVGRLGAGASREFGGGSDRVVPEIVASTTLDWAPVDGQRLAAGVEFFPDLREPGEYRFNVRAAWDMQVAASRGLHLRVGLEDRFDSTPEGARRNDFDYFLSLVWKF